MDTDSEYELSAVLGLFKLVFGRELSPSFYRWRFIHNPFGPPYISLLWDGDVLAGHYAASAMRGWLGGPFASSQSMTTMTHPLYRNRDVFTQLASDLYERLGNAGVRMIWGYPNTKSHFGLVQRLAWSDVAILPTLTRELVDTDVVASEALTDTREPPAGTRDIFTRSDDGRLFLSARDFEYLKWRYVDNPDTRYRFFALANCDSVLAIAKDFSLSNGQTSLELVDFLYAQRPDGLVALMKQIFAWARKRAYAYVRCWATLDDPAYPHLERLSFIPREPLTYFCVRPLGTSPVETRNVRIRVSMGDSDNY